MISIDEIADFTIRCERTLDSAAKRIKELEAENKALKDSLVKLTPKE